VDPDRDDAVRLRRGDLAGLTGLMERYQERLFRYLVRLLGDETVAEDVFQQTWLRVTERISRYEASRPFGPWLFAVARNLAFDHLRRYQPESLGDEEESAAGIAGPDGSVEGSPLARFAITERGARLAAAIGALPALDREVLALRFEQDLALVDVASVLGVSLTTAKARLYRALARLKRGLLAQGPREDWT
jgi:RNA polymerase sigma-70 factor (ECF subfamily)